MTDSRSARTSAQVAVDADVASDARSARTSAQAIVANDVASDARSARVSAQAIVANEQPSDARSARVSIQVMVEVVPMAGLSDGVATVTGDLTTIATGEYQTRIDSTSTVTASLDVVRKLSGLSSGEAAVTGKLFQSGKYFKEVTSDSPLAYYRFTDFAGRLVDSSGNSRSLTANGSMTETAGLVASIPDDLAVKSTGTAQYLYRTDSTLSQLHDAWTVEAWVMRTGSVTEGAVVTTNFAGSTVTYALRTISGDKIQAAIYTGGSWHTVEATLTVDTIHHIVGTYDGTTLRLYQDGAEVGSGLSVSSYTSTTTVIYISKRWDTTNHFPGTIDEVSIYGSALSAERVAAHYAAGVGTCWADSSGAATVTGSLTNIFGGIIDVYATPDGVATAAGTLTLGVEPSGATDGVATVTGDLVGLAALTGASDGTSTVTGALKQIVESSGASDGVATASASLTNSPPTTAQMARASMSVAMDNSSPTTTNAQMARVSLTFARAVEPWGATSEGVATIVGDLTTKGTNELEGLSAGVGHITGSTVLSTTPDGVAHVTGWLHVTKELSGQSDGVAEVTSTTGKIRDRIPGPIPYPFPHLNPFVHELVAIVLANSTVAGTLNVFNNAAGVSDGVATVEATLYAEAGSGPQAGVSDGTSTVSGILDGDDFIVELEGYSDGVGRLYHQLASDSINQARYLYILNNVKVGFDPIDDASGVADFVSQTYPDGDAKDFDKYLYLPQNVGVSFDPTDDVSATLDGFISQVFADGDIKDFHRWLYLENTVFALPDEPRRLTIGPTPKLPISMLRGKPPVSKVGRGPEVV